MTVTAGQMRVPFSIDAHRSPHQQHFANRSFIAKQVGNIRDVGVTLGYAFGNMHAVNSFVGYDLPLRRVFRKLSFLARDDMMTSQSDGKTIDEATGALSTTDYKRHRLTSGITFSLSKAFCTDLRLNFEKYFYARNSRAKESEQDKIVLELMVRF